MATLCSIFSVRLLLSKYRSIYSFHFLLCLVAQNDASYSMESSNKQQSRFIFFVLATIKKEDEYVFLQPKSSPCFYLIPEGRLLQIPPRMTPHHNVAELSTKVALDWSPTYATPLVRNIATTPTKRRPLRPSRFPPYTLV